MSKEIGFDGRSFREMESLWAGITLFYFIASGRTYMVSRAQMIYEDNQAPREKIFRTLLDHFGDRAAKCSPQVLLIDKMLFVDLDFRLGLEIRPATLKRWETPEFDLMREIDSVLVAAGVQEGKRHPERSFFRGQILND